ncbi:MAG: Ig-like domain-containing protein, partial [Deltaproteobacteria bacterium]|nr:Ig-like domain-containing protein [Deltaproteobacteria bacterium]
MKNIRFVLAIFFLGSLAVSLTTCAGSLGLNGIVVTPANPSIPLGVREQFTATGYYNDGTSHDITTQVTWSSSNPSVATVDSTGLATAFSLGTATITATSATPSSYSNTGSLGSTTLTVTTANLSSLAVTPVNPSISVGAIQQFTATGTYSNGTSNDIATQVTWSSSDTSVATIDSNGQAIAVSIGTTTITATSGSISGSTTLTV